MVDNTLALRVERTQFGKDFIQGYKQGFRCRGDDAVAAALATAWLSVATALGE